MTTLTHHSLIRAAEVWAAPEDTDELQPSSTLRTEVYGSLASDVIERLRRARAPLVVHRRDSAIVEEPVSLMSESGAAVLGFPVFADGKLKAAMILYLECLENSLGAVEIWARDRRDELLVNGAVYANLGRFANISRFVRFPRASGLPGRCWEDREAKLVRGLGHAPEFMCAAGARAGGLDFGVALPVMTSEFDLHSVVLLLSSQRSPIARVFEIWDRDEVADQLYLRDSGSTSCQTFGSNTSRSFAPTDGIVKTVWDSGIPLVTDDFAAADPERAEFARNSELTTAIAIPIWVGAEVKSVFVMLS